MCNCRGSERSKPSDEEFSTRTSGLETSEDSAETRSCTSASTGGGEGCLIISTVTGVSIVSKEIIESGSPVLSISELSFELEIDSLLGFSGLILQHSVFAGGPLSRGGRRLLSTMVHQIKKIKLITINPSNKFISKGTDNHQKSGRTPTGVSTPNMFKFLSINHNDFRRVQFIKFYFQNSHKKKKQRENI